MHMCYKIYGVRAWEKAETRGRGQPGAVIPFRSSGITLMAIRAAREGESSQPPSWGG